MKRAIQRARAQQDIVAAFEYYLAEAGGAVAAAFVQALDACMTHIEQFPQAGSPRYAELLDIEGLRFVLIERFPYAVFYFERADNVDVVRVLHQHRDIPAMLAQTIEP